MRIFVFGNGNLSFDNFLKYYSIPLQKIIHEENANFLLCDFRGTDTLMIEFLKCITSNVSIYHIGDKPRYTPDSFKTKVADWKFINGFKSDKERDIAAINNCTHFLAYDFNSDEKRKSGTLKNIELCLSQNKIDIKSILL
jgi:hypothetical protein